MRVYWRFAQSAWEDREEGVSAGRGSGRERETLRGSYIGSTRRGPSSFWADLRVPLSGWGQEAHSSGVMCLRTGCVISMD